jgi:signal transduction histidine kinase
LVNQFFLFKSTIAPKPYSEMPINHPPSAPIEPAVQRIRACLPEIGSHGLKVVGFCVVMGLALWWFRADVPLDVQLVYSLCSGLIIWILIDFGRFFVDTSSPYQFPRGWRAIALIAAGCCVGYVLGTLMGDTYSGRSTWNMFSDKPRMLLNLFLLTVVSGVAISYFFYAAGKSQYLTNALQSSQSQATQARLLLLQSQLDPHMLFNTLANLRALISTDPQRATHMLDRMNDYLRSTLGASRATEHALSAEFDRLRDYLELMQIRMGERLRYRLDLPAALASLHVPPLILQSLVENAIVHGLEPQVAGGEVHVSAQADGDMLVLQVCDTGAGFDTANTPEGFGITQVRDRIATRYGTHATMNLIAARALNHWASGLKDGENTFSDAPIEDAALHGTTILLRLPTMLAKTP